MTKFKAAAIQMGCVLKNVDANIERTISLVNQAASEGAKIIGLPELFNTGYYVGDYSAFAEEIPGGRTTGELEKLCKQLQVYIFGGIIEKGDKGKEVYDTAILVGPNGYIGKYRKTHLFTVESHFSPGNSLELFDTEFGRTCFVICYEVGFPELTRTLVKRGAEFVLVTSAYGRPRSYAWEISTQARALENGIFIIASNRTGEEPEEAFAGHSRIIGPRGNIIADAELKETIVYGNVDPDEMESQRNTIPYLRDLRPDLYQ